MSTQTTTPSEISIRQAELILKLYELCRETVMREARSYIGGEFLPASADERVEIVTAGGKRGGFVLQVVRDKRRNVELFSAAELQPELLLRDVKPSSRGEQGFSVQASGTL